MRTAWGRLPLRARLVALFSALLLLALATVGTLALTLLQRSLVAEVDAQLERAAQTYVNTAVSRFSGFSDLAELDDGATSSLVPSDYSVVLARSDGSELVRCVGGDCTTGATIGSAIRGPAVGAMDLQAVLATSGVPFTSGGVAGGERWRVVLAPVTQGDHVIGTAAVALPLGATDATMRMMAGALMVVGGSVLLVAGLATYAVVRSSLEPLRRIETTAARIAAGDLSQRVEPAPETTEVGSLALSLNTMLGHLETSFESQRASEHRMQRFVGDASHELRTPLATVRGYTELYRLGGIPTDELPAVMTRIEGSATRMSTLVADLLSLARLDQGGDLRIEPLEVAALLADSANDLRVLDPDRRVTVDASGTAGAQVLADEGALRRVLTNLVANAVAYTPAGSPVELVAALDGDDVLLEVRDHGPGIPEADRERVFERFARLDSGRTRDAGGSGLGLSIAHAMTTAMGGEIVCVETAGGGATMQVRLPRETPGLG